MKRNSLLLALFSLLASVSAFAQVNPCATSISYVGSPYCQLDTGAIPFITGNASGSFLGTPGIVIDTSTGAIDLPFSLPGTYIIGFHVLDSLNACDTTVYDTIEILAPMNAVIVYQDTLCAQDTGWVGPILTPIFGGNFFAPFGVVIDMVTGAIRPSMSVPGTYAITFTPSAGFCAFPAMDTVTITACGTASLDKRRVPTFDVYPVPGRGSVTIEAKGSRPNAVGRLIDLQGRVWREIHVRGLATLSLEGISPGFYILELNDGVRKLRFDLPVVR